jgi:hypothetical protein
MVKLKSNPYSHKHTIEIRKRVTEAKYVISTNTYLEEVTALDHEIFDDSMEGRVLVSCGKTFIQMLTGAKFPVKHNCNMC